MVEPEGGGRRLTGFHLGGRIYRNNLTQPYWEKLSAVPEAEQCGWLKDKYGLSWQVWPVEMGEMMKNGTPEQIARVTQAFLPMKKFDIAKLKKAYEGK